MIFFAIISRIKKFQYTPELVLFFSFLICIYKLDLSWFNSHMSRDFIRSIEWLYLKPSSCLGPEMGWDFKRLPGPAYYWISGLFWTLTHSIEGILFFKIFLTVAIIYFLIKELKKKYSLTFVSLFAMQFLLTPVYIETLRNMWNPSLIVTFCCLIFLGTLKYVENKKPFWLWFCFVSVIFGIQIHFSVAIPYLALISVCLLFRNHLKIIFLQLFLLLSGLFAWIFLNPTPQLERQLDNFYGLNNPYLLNRLFDLGYHLSLRLTAIEDYDLFYLLTKTAVRLGWISATFVNIVNPILNFLFLVLFLVTLIFLLFRHFKKKLEWLEIFALLWFLFFSVSLIVTRHKPEIPYRYGLSLFPIQFFLLFLGFEKLKPYFKSKMIFLYLFCICVSLSHIYFILNFYNIQELTGRTHHTQNDNLELNLKMKKYIYSLNPITSTTDDPLMLWHGRSINKMRLKEMNWEQTQPYYGLYASLARKKVAFHESIKYLPAQSSWLFQLHNLKEFALKPQAPFLLTELKTENLPQNLMIKYLNSESNGLDKVSWPNTNLIMPLAFLEKNSTAKILRLEFDLNTTDNKYLNLLIDDNSTYKFAYQTPYKLLQVRINSKMQNPIEKYPGFFLNQNQYIFILPKDLNEVRVVIELKIETNQIPNYTRLDLFTTAYILPREELFP